MTMLAVDLYSGIGGATLGLKAAGFEVCYACESDPVPADIYDKNMHPCERKKVQDIEPNKVPHVELVFASPPSQAELPAIIGFVDKTNPRVIVLEFPVRLVNQEIVHSRTELTFGNYRCWCGVLNASMFGLAQQKRIAYIVGRRSDVIVESNEFKFSNGEKKAGIKSIFEETPDSKLLASPERLARIQQTNERNLKGGTGFQTKVYAGDEPVPALPVKYYKDYRNILVDSGTGPRRLSALECKRLMGFPDGFEMKTSELQQYRMLALASCPPVVEAIVKQAAAWTRCG
jgi:DNA (cytosine-5)-methyltransferase 1